MKYFRNTGYFLKETCLLFGGQLFSGLVSLLGSALLLLLLGLMLTGSSAAKMLVDSLKEEAEINVYASSADNMEYVFNSIKRTEGVRKAVLVDKEEAFERMEGLLEEDAEILSVFEENPLEAFVEVTVSLEDTDGVIGRIKNIPGVEYVRDNEEILQRIKGISRFIGNISLFVLGVVSMTSFILLSHMIRQGIDKNREQIKTLRLLGAPESFIGIPYVFYGFLFNLCAGGLASMFLGNLIHSIYESMNFNIPFLPLPEEGELLSRITKVLFLYSGALGLVISLISLPTVSGKRMGKKKAGVKSAVKHQP